MQVLPIILGLVNLVDQAYKAVIGVLWSALVTYGLQPKYAFLVQFTSFAPYQGMENAFIGSGYFQFAIIIVLIATVFTLFLNSFGKTQNLHIFIFKVAVAIILGSVSFIVTIWVFSKLSVMYAAVYSSAGINWSNFLLFSSSNYFTGSGATAGGGYSFLIEAFTLTGYFTSVVSLFSILMLRQALLLFSIAILPFATILIIFDRGRKFAERVWEIVIEMAAYPFFVLLCLYLGHIFSWDIPLQLAFLFLPSILPGYLFVSGRSFLTAPILGFMSGMTMAGAVGRGIETAGIVTELARNGPSVGALKNASMIPFTESRTTNLQGSGHNKSTELPWKDLINEELKFRKE